MDKEQRKRRIAEIEEEIASLEGNWPKHSPKPTLLIRIEELEEELKTLLDEEKKEASS